MEKLIQAFSIALKEPLSYLFVLLVALAAFIYFKLYKLDRRLKEVGKQYSSIEKNIQYAVAPKYIDLSPTTKSLIALAIETWRIQQRIRLIKDDVPKDKITSLENSASKLSQLLNDYDVEVVDHSGEKYNEGMNLEVLSIEKNPSIRNPLIKEVMEPTVMIKGQVVNKAKVILVKP